MNIRSCRTGRTTPLHDTVRVTAKRCNVVANPLKSSTLVHDAEVLLAQATSIGEPEDVEAVVDADNNVLLRSLNPGRGNLPGQVDTTHDPASACHKEEHW